MLFSSVTFLCYFLPAVLITYFLIKNRSWRNGVLTVFSLLFYGWGGIQGLSVMVGSIVLNWSMALAISKSSDKHRRKAILMAAAVVNLCVIGYFKYSAFFINGISGLLGYGEIFEKVFMPIGISFFTFQAMSYVVDVYRDNDLARKNIMDVALYIALFPQLVAGPIVRYNCIAEAITNRRESIADFTGGVRRFIYGLGKKLLLANAAGLIAADIFQFKPDELSVLGAWIGAIAYTLQIYLDFSAYSDMAIGLGRMFGFHFDENFNYPYISKSITEFWRRWHISLSTWFRDYIYIPLGGSRVKTFRHIFNILAVWMLTGLWHGAEWTFIIWGVYYGVLLLLEKYVFGDFINKMPKILRQIFVMLLVIIGWVIFRSETLVYARDYIGSMFGFGGQPLADDKAWYYIMRYPLVWPTCLLAVLPIKHTINKWLQKPGAGILTAVWELSVFGLSVIEVINTTFNPFIYFRF